eukprot:TRINITY_DN3763_c0_g2_i2.p1 TRINITY_DN3763_c0_g2~~TRINITY_DN3763_c0_g2_i2.p1  ORF type:complete len:115 (-),score=30.82 TRINITY_DN3763_c0_g2_i2:99-443(-)
MEVSTSIQAHGQNIFQLQLVAENNPNPLLGLISAIRSLRDQSRAFLTAEVIKEKSQLPKLQKKLKARKQPSEDDSDEGDEEDMEPEDDLDDDLEEKEDDSGSNDAGQPQKKHRS